MMTSPQPDNQNEYDARFLSRFSKLALGFMVTAGCARGAPLCIDDRCSSSAVESDGTDSTGEETFPDIDPIGAGVDGELLAEQTINILSERCGGCHRTPPGSGGIDYITDLGQLIANGYIVPGSAEASTLYERIESGQMPLGGPVLPTTELAVIRQWINSGASVPEGEEACENKAVTYSDLYAMMEIDLTGVPNEDQRFTRYLSLHDLYNRGACEADLEVAHRIATKLVNSLSSNFTRRRPSPTGTSGVLLRLDLRDYGWQPDGPAAEDLWEFAASQNPYAIEFEGDNGVSVNASTATAFPVQTLASFLHVTSRAPNYYRFTGFPSQLTDFLNDAGVDIVEAQDTGEAVRSGSRNSEVTFFGRILERIPFAANRTLWLSYDFDSETEEASILDNPVDAAHRENQLIYTLPNGLHAYAIVDAAGDRQNTVSLDIMRDPLQRDQTATAGISCMSCHQQGIAPMADQIRAHVLKYPFLYGADTFEKVLDLYIEPERFQGKIEGDNTFLEANHTILGLDFAGNDGIVEASIKFERELSLEDFAAELGIDPTAVANAVNLVDDNLLTLKNGGVVSREIVDETFVRVQCLFLTDTLTVAETHCTQ